MDKNFAYSQKSINKSTAWLMFLFLGWGPGNFGKIGTQILYWITLGGFGIWTLITLFTLNGDIREYNIKVATDIGFTSEEIKALI